MILPDRTTFTKDTDAKFNPEGSYHGAKASLGEVGKSKGSVVVYEGGAPVDPSVQVSLYQGPELASHLVDVARAFTDDSAPIQAFESMSAKMPLLTLLAIRCRMIPQKNRGSSVRRLCGSK